MGKQKRQTTHGEKGRKRHASGKIKGEARGNYVEVSECGRIATYWFYEISDPLAFFRMNNFKK